MLIIVLFLQFFENFVRFSLISKDSIKKGATQRVALNSRYDKLGFPDIIH